MKDNRENSSYSDSVEKKNERDIEHTEESFIRNWFKELKMDVKRLSLLLLH